MTICITSIARVVSFHFTIQHKYIFVRKILLYRRFGFNMICSLKYSQNFIRQSELYLLNSWTFVIWIGWKLCFLKIRLFDLDPPDAAETDLIDWMLFSCCLMTYISLWIGFIDNSCRTQGPSLLWYHNATISTLYSTEYTISNIFRYTFVNNMLRTTWVFNIKQKNGRHIFCHAKIFNFSFFFIFFSLT